MSSFKAAKLPLQKHANATFSDSLGNSGNSGQLGPLDPPFHAMFADGEQMSLEDVQQYLKRMKSQQEKHITEITDLLNETLAQINEAHEKRQATMTVVRKMNETPQALATYSRPMILRNCQEQTDAEITYIKMCEVRDRLTDQLTSLKSSNQALQVAMQVSEEAVRLEQVMQQYSDIDATTDSTYDDPPSMSIEELCTAREGERHVLAQQIEQRICTMLASAVQRIQIMTNAPDMPSPAQAVISDVQRYLSQAFHEARMLAMELEPQLGELGLAAILGQYVQLLTSVRGVPITTAITPIPLRFQIGIERAAFRAACEFIDNALLHSRARHIHITVYAVDDGLAITVEDDGIGCDVSSIEANLRQRASGLADVAMTAEMIGATWGMESGHGRGTRMDYVVTRTMAAVAFGS